MQNFPKRLKDKEKGAVLVTASIMLIAILILGIAAIVVARQEEKLAGNLQYQLNAFNEAERTIATAEAWLTTANNFGSAAFVTRDATPTTNFHLYPANFLNGSTAARDPLRMTWNDTNSLQAGADNRRYLIERIATNKPLMGSSNDKKNINLYRIIVRAESTRGAVRFIQSVYSVRCYDIEQKKCSEYN